MNDPANSQSSESVTLRIDGPVAVIALNRPEKRNAIENAPIPWISAIHGATVGGGLELVASTHLRIADESAYFALPEGQRGIFVGGGGSVRIVRLIGAAGPLTCRRPLS
jgi:enoyl-CoA hydratase/carnithine racemase